MSSAVNLAAGIDGTVVETGETSETTGLRGGVGVEGFFHTCCCAELGEGWLGEDSSNSWEDEGTLWTTSFLEAAESGQRGHSVNTTTHGCNSNLSQTSHRHAAKHCQ